MPDPSATPTPEELRRLEKMNALSLSMEDAFQSMASSMAKFAKNHKEISEDDLPAATALAKDLAKSYNSLAKNSLNFIDNEEKLREGAIKAKDIQKQIAEIEKQELLNKRKYEILQSRGILLSQEELRIQADSLEYTQTQRAELAKQALEAKKIEKTAGLSSKIFEDIAKLPLLSKLVDAEKVTDAINKKAAETGNTFKAFGAGLSSIFGSAFKKLGDPLIVGGLLAIAFKGIWNINKELDQTLTDQGRQLAVNKEESYKLRDGAEKYAFATKDSFVTAALLTKNQIALNTALGTSVEYTNQSVEGFSRLTHYYGLSAESAGKLEQLGQLQGKNSNDVLKSTISTVAQIKLQQGGTISYQKVLSQVSNTGGDILMKFKGNTDALAAAIVNADKLGLSLEQVDKIGESLLNFESSIENELKAELLVGKSINLEKARQYALDGDLSKLTTEVAKQVGGIHEFEKMNVIQRKAYAEAFGMSNKEMSEMLQKADFEAKLGDKTKASAEEQLKYAKEHNITMTDSVKQALEQKSLADEQQEVFAKLKEVLVKITSGPMKVLFHQMEKILGIVGKITNLFGGMSGTGLASSLGAALLMIPAVMLLKNVFLRGTDMMPTVVRMQGGGMMGGMGGVNKLGGAGFGTDYRSLRTAGVGRREAFSMSNQANPMGRGMIGGIGMAAGMGLNAIAGGMDEGVGKDVVGGLGQTASYAGMGFMVGGPIGAGIGALVGLTTSLLDISQKADERAKAEEASRKEAEKRTNDLMNNLAIRPINLNVGNKTIMEFNTASDQYGNKNSRLGG